MRLFIGSVVAFFAVGVGDLLATTDYVNLQSGWQYRWSDSPVDPSTGRATWLDSPWDSPDWKPTATLHDPPGRTADQVVWFRIRLPEVPFENPALLLPPIQTSFDVYIDGRRIYRFGDFEPHVSRLANSTRHLISLDQHQGAMLALRVYTSSRQHIGITNPMERPLIGSADAVMKESIRTTFEVGMAGAIQIFIGLVALMIFLVRIRERVWLLLSLSMLCIGIGAFHFTLSHVGSILLDGTVLYFLRYGSFFIFPIFLLVFLRRILGHSRMNAIALWFHIVWAIMALVLELSGVTSMERLSHSFNYFFLVTIIIVLTTAFHSARGGNKDARVFLLGVTVLSVAGISDLLMGLGVLPFWRWISHWGMMVFILQLVYLSVRRYMRHQQLLQSYSSDLEEKSRELEEYAQTLETKVAMRTSELDAKNLALSDTLIELRDTHQQLILREKMASLGTLVAGVAHEVNNPIGAINSAVDVCRRCIDIVEQALAGDDDVRTSARVRQALDTLTENNSVMTTAGARVAAIVKSLKNFSRLDEAEFQSADIHAGLDSTLTLVHHQMKGRIEVIKDYGDIPQIECYPNQLNQVFMNLLINASQAIKETGTITIQTMTTDDSVVISITDTGAGIDPENVNQLFDPGFTTKGVGVGTGLGLSISYNIIEKHHGSIKVDSEVGKGSTFVISLPLSP